MRLSGRWRKQIGKIKTETQLEWRRRSNASPAMTAAGCARTILTSPGWSACLHLRRRWRTLPSLQRHHPGRSAAPAQGVQAGWRVTTAECAGGEAAAGCELEWKTRRPLMSYISTVAKRLGWCTNGLGQELSPLARGAPASGRIERSEVQAPVLLFQPRIILPRGVTPARDCSCLMPDSLSSLLESPGSLTSRAGHG